MIRATLINMIRRRIARHPAAVERRARSELSRKAAERARAEQVRAALAKFTNSGAGAAKEEMSNG